MSLAFSVLLKMGKYKFEINGVTIDARVTEEIEVIESHIVHHLRPLLDKDPMPVVGIDVKVNPQTPQGGPRKGILVLCVGKNCLVIQQRSGDLLVPCPEKLVGLVDDEKVSLVGVDVLEKLKLLRHTFKYNRFTNKCQYSKKKPLEYSMWMDFDELAARVLKKPSLEGSGLSDIAREVEVQYEPPAEGVSGVDWSARVFSEDEVKKAVYDAYCYCKIGKNLLGSLAD